LKGKNEADDALIAHDERVIPREGVERLDLIEFCERAHVIPREGVESEPEPLRDVLGLDREVIPREGVESREFGRILFDFVVNRVIPREGVERLYQCHDFHPDSKDSDPERGS